MTILQAFNAVGVGQEIFCTSLGAGRHAVKSSDDRLTLVDDNSGGSFTMEVGVLAIAASNLCVTKNLLEIASRDDWEVAT